MSDAAAHWNRIYGARPVETLSWYEPRPATSLRLLELASPDHGPVVDVGAGASVLVDALVADGWDDVTVLDVSAEALTAVRRRLAGRAVSFVETDLLAWRPDRAYAAWHDRAVLHFLTDPHDRRRYVDVATTAVAPGGAAVLGVFAADGPTECSGLPTVGYAPDALAALFASSFALEHSEREEHVTPAGVVQPFTWALLRRRP